VQTTTYLLEYNKTLLVFDYLRYKQAMEDWRADWKQDSSRAYMEQELLRHHTALFNHAPKQRNSDGTISVWLPAKGKQGQTYHLPRYRVYSSGKAHKDTIQIFHQGEFMDLPSFDDELVEHLVKPDAAGCIPALLYHEPLLAIEL
jgi:hypothetical protein